MKDEIKEILDKLKDNDWYEELDLTGTKWIELRQEETNQLLDYITNLQQENERLKKEQLNLKSELANMWECKARNEEAIDFVKKESKKCYSNRITDNPTKVIGNFMWHTDKLLNILNGGDKNDNQTNN